MAVGANCGECSKCVDVRRALIEAEVEEQPNWLTPVRVWDRPWLREFRLYINNKCQKRCPFCSYEKYSSSAKTDTIHIPAWIEVIDKAKKLGIKSLMYSGKEPLYDDRIFRLLDYAGRDFKQHVNTNGINLLRFKDELEKRVKNEYLDRILVSLNYSDTYPLIDDMGQFDCRDAFQPYILINENTKSHLGKIINGCIDYGITRFYLRFEYPTKYTVREQEDILKLLMVGAANYTDHDLLMETPIEWNNVGEDGIFGEAMEDYSRLGFARYNPLPNLTLRFTFPHAECQAYYHTLTILHDGTILGCAKHSYLPYEKLKKLSIGSILFMSAREIEDACTRKIEKRPRMCLPDWRTNR